MTDDFKDLLTKAADRIGTDDRAAFEQLRTARARKSRRERMTAIAGGLAIAAVAIAIVLIAFRPGADDEGALPAGPDGAADDAFIYSKHEKGGWHVYRADPDTGEEIQLTDGVRDYGADWSPDASQIVYGTEEFPGSDAFTTLVIANSDGSDPHELTPGDNPSWSPAGDRIAFVDNGIWIVNTDGSGRRRITNGSNDWNPQWSPDGQSLSYTTTDENGGDPAPGQLRIWSDAGGAESDRLVTDAFGDMGQGDWSPDGTHLVFTGRSLEATDDELVWPALLTIAVDGSDLRTVVPAGDAWTQDANWSPDGDWLQFSYDSGGIFLVHPDGTGLHALDIAGGEEVQELEWGPAAAPAPAATQPPTDVAVEPAAARTNGLIAFTTRSPWWKIAVVEPDGSNYRIVPGSEGGYAATWSPDGTELAIATTDGDSGTFSDRILLLGLDGSKHGDIQADDGSYQDPAWSPVDPDKILVTRSAAARETETERGPVAVESIVILRRDGSVIDEFGDPAMSIPGGPRWSWDGSKIAYGRSDLEKLGVWVSAPDGSGAVRIHEGWGQVHGWTPDGQRILWSDDRNQLHMIGADGTGDAVLAVDLIDPWGIDISPDGTKITYSDAGNIVVANLDGTAAEHVGSGDGGDDEQYMPVWGPAAAP